MSHDDYSDDVLREILGRVRRIALVGASPNPSRASHVVMAYLQKQGYRVLPINPQVAGQVILGEIVHAELAALPEPVDMVDIFRNSAAAGPITDQAISLGAISLGTPSVVWMQLDVRDDQAAARAEAAGLQVVMNRCPKLEYQRLFGDRV